MNQERINYHDAVSQENLRESIRGIHSAVDLGEHWPNVNCVSQRVKGPRQDAQRCHQRTAVAATVALVGRLIALIDPKHLEAAVLELRTELDDEAQAIAEAEAKASEAAEYESQASREEAERLARKAEKQFDALHRAELNADADSKPKQPPKKPEGDKKPKNNEPAPSKPPAPPEKPEGDKKPEPTPEGGESKPTEPGSEDKKEGDLPNINDEPPPK